MQQSLPFLSGQIEYLEKSLAFVKKELTRMGKKTGEKTRLFGSLPKTNLSLEAFKNIRKTLSSSWENEWK